MIGRRNRRKPYRLYVLASDYRTARRWVDAVEIPTPLVKVITELNVDQLLGLVRPFVFTSGGAPLHLRSRAALCGALNVGQGDDWVPYWYPTQDGNGERWTLADASGSYLDIEGSFRTYGHAEAMATHHNHETRGRR